MRSIWSGIIRFGLVNFPVKLYAAVKEKKLNLDYLRKQDLCRIRYARVCETTGEEVRYKDIVKGYEYKKGDYVVLTDDDLRKASAHRPRSIDITDFSNLSDIDVKLFEKPLFVEPGKEGRKMYALLREAMKRRQKVAVVKYVLKTREHIGILKAEEDALVLVQMRYVSDLRRPSALSLPGAGEISEREIELAVKLVSQMSAPFDPLDFKDTYSEELKGLVESKVRGKRLPSEPEKPVATKIQELMERLQESLSVTSK